MTTASGWSREQANAGMGIIDMRDRIEAVAGVFEMISAPGHGASIRATIPGGEASAAAVPR